MAENSKIEWCDATVNFWWGCTKIAPGCDNCYAERWSNRFGDNHWGIDAPRRKIKSAVKLIHRLDNFYSEWGADYECHAARCRGLGKPAKFGPRQRVFIQSMSDLFDNEVPLPWFQEAWEKIEICKRIDALIVTKRISNVEKRLAAIGRSAWQTPAMLLITVVNQEEANRDIPRLLALKEKLGIPLIGLSIEPMLGLIDLSPWLDHIDWVICGGESGPKARPMHPDWARSLRDQCKASSVAFFFKQWGEWEVIYDRDIHDPGWGRCGDVADGDPKGRWLNLEGGHGFHGDGVIRVTPVGKALSGRMLDGCEWSEYPARFMNHYTYSPKEPANA